MLLRAGYAHQLYEEEKTLAVQLEYEKSDETDHQSDHRQTKVNLDFSPHKSSVSFSDQTDETQNQLIKLGYEYIEPYTFTVFGVMNVDGEGEAEGKLGIEVELENSPSGKVPFDQYCPHSILFHSILFHFSILFHCFRAVRMKQN